MSREAKILIGILVVVVGGMIGLFIYANQGSSSSAGVGPAVSDQTLLKSDTHHEGNGSVKLVEFGDYQCPACGAAYPVVKQIMKEYNGKVTLYFRNFPLTNLHPNAMAAANAAEAAADQGKFWEMHDALYEHQDDWAKLPTDQAADKWASYATALGLDGDKIKAAAVGETKKDRIAADINDGNTLQIQGTPTFFVNDHQVTAGNSYDDLKAAIEAALHSGK